jgi:hypothetical protein
MYDESNTNGKLLYIIHNRMLQFDDAEREGCILRARSEEQSPALLEIDMPKVAN